ncbi:hypothetical protein [Achromobacter sp. UMC71]|uniref:hypothetical protein n=1 Tax=Achromobacter sp. UMC71 TaxID=1862320 RepID=UPI001602660E|nr:hypothetical protein [Achromobacter sp. UMC71]
MFDAFRRKKRKQIGSVDLYYLPNSPAAPKFSAERQASKADRLENRAEKNKQKRIAWEGESYVSKQ